MHAHLQSVIEAFRALSVRGEVRALAIPEPMTANPPAVIAVLGLGRGRLEIAADLVAAGAIVQAYDPKVAAPAAVRGFGSDADAARGASVILALTSAHEARRRCASAARHRRWGDLRRPEHRLGRAQGEAGADGGARGRLPSPMSRSWRRYQGPACARRCWRAGRPPASTHAFSRSLGAGVTVLPGPPGTAATRKLVRSVFYKGLAAAVTEALRAGRAAGCEDWLRDDIGQVLADASAATVDRLEHGSIRHARRRADEMMAASDLLDELGVPARVAQGQPGLADAADDRDRARRLTAR